jgi:tetratricopeptide (TPR) repeat protein
MAQSMPSDRSDQSVHQIAQSPSVEAVIHENVSEVVSDAARPVTSVNSNDKKVQEARHTVTQLSVDHPEWLNRSRELVALLSKLFEETSQITLLFECIDIQQQICTICTTGDSDRAGSVSDLAASLLKCFMQTGEGSVLNEAIILNREALRLRPRGHPERSIMCMNLASSLWTHFEQTGEQSLLSEAIDLFREALLLRPREHPDRSISCNRLAAALHTRFNQTGEENLLAEVTELYREALSLVPSGHPDRFRPCNNLANLLLTRFNQTGEESLLAEAVELHRETRAVQPSGHPLRSLSCNNLAGSLYTLFNHTGEESLLAEAIDLSREALSLQSSGHPTRSMSCNSLANSLWTRFNQTGEESLLIEVIELHKEALALRPRGHPDWSQSCNNLALSLWERFNQTGEESLLTTAIELHRETLSVRPSGHPGRFMSCSNLANALYARFKQTREESVLVEAIDLHREAVSLQTSMHPHRLEVCNRLVASLRTYFELTGDEALLVEAINLNKDSMETQPQHHPSRWKPIINQVHIYLNRCFSLRNTALAIDYLEQALSLISYDWPALLSEVAQLTTLIDLPMLSHESLSQLLHCFSAAIDLASRVAGFVLDPQSQLRYLRDSQHLGPRAYWCALACRQPQLGLELIERARAMMWTQSLHMRNPHLTGAPTELSSELELLLHSMNSSHTAPQSSSTDQDARYKHATRIHQLIQQIRATPGHNGFMRGLPFEELAKCACRNVVVILVATEGECHALTLRPKHQEPLTLKLSNIAPDELATMSIEGSAAQRKSYIPDAMNNRYRGMKGSPYQMSSHRTRQDPILERLWTTVVKPIFNQLRLQVCNII